MSCLMIYPPLNSLSPKDPNEHRKCIMEAMKEFKDGQHFFAFKVSMINIRFSFIKS